MFPAPCRPPPSGLLRLRHRQAYPVVERLPELEQPHDEEQQQRNHNRELDRRLASLAAPFRRADSPPHCSHLPSGWLSATFVARAVDADPRLASSAGNATLQAVRAADDAHEERRRPEHSVPTSSSRTGGSGRRSPAIRDPCWFPSRSRGLCRCRRRRRCSGG